MAGVFKKLSANDIKITPFEAHKKYSSTDLSSIGVSTDFVSWAPYNKAYFIDDNRKYYQIDKLYYRDYVKTRAHRIELNDATYTTQERRLYEYANVISLPQRNFGNEVQPGTFILSCSYSSSEEQFYILDDSFGNLYDANKGKDNFPNEDYRILYIGPTQAFKRADLTIDYETGKKYVNDPFPNGYTRTVYDDSYFLNEVEFKNVEFITSSNSGFYNIKTPLYVEPQAEIEPSITAGDISLATGVGFSGTSITDKGNAIDNNTSTYAIINQGISTGERGGFVFDFGTGKLIHSISFKQGQSDLTKTWRLEISKDGTNFITDQECTFSSTFTKTSFNLKNPGIIKKIRLSQEATSSSPVAVIKFPRIFEIDFLVSVGESYIKIPHQPQFNFETDNDFTINFYYDLSPIDQENSITDGNYFILTKEGTKSVPILPSEGTQHTPLSRSGSSQIGTAPVGAQFPYRIYYKGNYPSANTSSLFFERSDGEATQVVTASFFESGSTDTQKFISCQNDEGELKLTINDQIVSSSEQNSPTLSKTVSNKANITLYNKPEPNGSYSNFIGYDGGQIRQLMMWNQALSTTELTNISESIVGTPNIGNLFYDNGFAVITHPSYKNVLNNYDFNGFNSVTSASISSSALSFSRPSGGTFNNDGTKLILTSNQTDATVEFTLDTPFDVTSLITSRSFSGYGTNNYSVIFNNDGSKVYFNLNNPADTIRSFNLSSSYDLESKYNENSIQITTPNGDDVRSIAWSNDGTKFFTTTVNGDINQYISNDPFDLDDISYDYTYNVGHTGNIEGIRFDNSGYKMFIIHNSSGQIYLTQFILDKPFELKSLNENNRFNSRADIYQWGSSATDDIKYPSDIIFNNDGTKAYITLYSEAGGYEGNGSESDYIWQFDLPQHINKFEYKNTHLITENEYQCTMTEDEFEFTRNTSVLKIPFSDSEDIANFATGSNFKPYITSVGLYDDDGNLLVVGKLGQPIKASSETDTTFVIRFDT